MLHIDDVQNMGGVVFDELPKARVTAMNHLFSAPYFILTLNEFTYGFQSISNIQRHREVQHHPEGGVNDRQILVGRPNDNIYTLSLNRGYIIHGPDAVTDKLMKSAATLIPNELARKLALIAINSASPQSALENGPSIGFIQAFSRQKKLVAMFSFLSLGMTEWRLSDFSATSSEALIETIDIEHTGLTMLPATWIPSIAQPAMSWRGEIDDGMDTMAEIMRKNKESFEERQKEIAKLEEEKKNIRKKIADLEEERKQLEDGINKDRKAKLDELKKARDKQEADRLKKQQEMEDAKKALDEKNREKIADLKEKRKKAEETRQQAEDDKQKELEDRARAKEETQKQYDEEMKKRQEAADKRKEEREAKEKEREEKNKEMEDAKKALDEKNREKIAENQKKAEENQKDEAKAALERDAANEAAQKAKEDDKERRTEAQQGRVERQKEQDQENVDKVHEATKKAEESMKNEQ